MGRPQLETENLIAGCQSGKLWLSGISDPQASKMGKFDSSKKDDKGHFQNADCLTGGKGGRRETA